MHHGELLAPGRKINLILNDDLSSFKKEERRRHGRPKERLAWNCVRRASELLEEKSNGENGESLSNGFSNYRSDPLRNRLSYCDL